MIFSLSCPVHFRNRKLEVGRGLAIDIHANEKKLLTPSRGEVKKQTEEFNKAQEYGDLLCAHKYSCVSQLPKRMILLYNNIRIGSYYDDIKGFPR